MRHISLWMQMKSILQRSGNGEGASTGSSPFHTSPVALFSGEISSPLSSHWCNLSDLPLASTAWKHTNMEHYARIWSRICPSEEVETFPQGLWREMSPKETVSTKTRPHFTPKRLKQNIFKLNNSFCRHSLKDRKSWLEHRALLLGTCPVSAGVMQGESWNH